MLNVCILTGNLGGDPEVSYSSQGTPIAKFNLAFSTGKDKTSWLKVVCFNRQAETAEKYLHKGAKIGVVGTLEQEKWETQNGETRTNYRLIANTLEFIKTDGRGFENGNDDTPF